MFKPVLRQNLPSAKVKHIAVSKYDDLLINKLKNLNIEPVFTVPSENLEKRVCSHSDMLLFVLNNKSILIDESQKYNIDKFLTIGYKCKILNNTVKSPYPNDCRLNTVLMGDKLFYNEKSTDKSILNYYRSKSFKLIPVNQGYIKCSVCPVNENALITDDISVFNAAQSNEIDTLYISKGSVKLDGFDYGFIGGCTGLIDKNKLLFNGDINYHSDYGRIIDFLSKYNVEPEIIKDKPLYDVGSIIPLTEYVNC